MFDVAGNSLYRLQKEKRLLNAAAFERVFKKASRSRDKWFTVLCTQSDRDNPRLGMAISKKNCRLATDRNRIKRVVRESFRQHQADLQGLDIVVMNQVAAAQASNKELFASMAGHWRSCSRASDDKGTQEQS